MKNFILFLICVLLCVLSFIGGYTLSQSLSILTTRDKLWLTLYDNLDRKAITGYDETGILAFGKDGIVITSDWRFPNNKAPAMAQLQQDYCGELEKRIVKK